MRLRFWTTPEPVSTPQPDPLVLARLELAATKIKLAAVESALVQSLGQSTSLAAMVTAERAAREQTEACYRRLIADYNALALTSMNFVERLARDQDAPEDGLLDGLVRQ